MPHRLPLQPETEKLLDEAAPAFASRIDLEILSASLPKECHPAIAFLSQVWAFVPNVSNLKVTVQNTDEDQHSPTLKGSQESGRAEVLSRIFLTALETEDHAFFQQLADALKPKDKDAELSELQKERIQIMQAYEDATEESTPPSIREVTDTLFQINPDIPGKPEIIRNRIRNLFKSKGIPFRAEHIDR